MFAHYPPNCYPLKKLWNISSETQKEKISKSCLSFWNWSTWSDQFIGRNSELPSKSSQQGIYIYRKIRKSSFPILDIYWLFIGPRSTTLSEKFREVQIYQQMINWLKTN